MAKQAYVYGKRSLRIWPMKGYAYGKRDVLIWQKKPTYTARENKQQLVAYLRSATVSGNRTGERVTASSDAGKCV